jgi:hypothetical protein
MKFESDLKSKVDSVVIQLAAWRTSSLHGCFTSIENEAEAVFWRFVEKVLTAAKVRVRVYMSYSGS